VLRRRTSSTAEDRREREVRYALNKKGVASKRGRPADCPRGRRLCTKREDAANALAREMGIGRVRDRTKSPKTLQGLSQWVPPKSLRVGGVPGVSMRASRLNGKNNKESVAQTREGNSKGGCYQTRSSHNEITAPAWQTLDTCRQRTDEKAADVRSARVTRGEAKCKVRGSALSL